MESDALVTADLARVSPTKLQPRDVGHGTREPVEEASPETGALPVERDAEPRSGHQICETSGLKMVLDEKHGVHSPP